MDPQATDIDVAGFLGGIDEDIAAMDLAPHRFYRQEVRRRKTNWKLVMDAFQEIYHIKRLHSRTIAPFFLDTKSAGESADRHVRLLVARDGMEKVKRKPQSAWDLRRDVTFSHIVFPNNVIIYHPDYTSLLNVFPAGVDETVFAHTMFTPHAPRDEKEARHWERPFAMIDGGVFGEEDLFISEQIQLGLNSGANDSFVLGRFEHQLRWFHENIDKMLVPAPGTVDAPGLDGAPMFGRLQPIDQALHVLVGVPVRHQHRVGGGHDDQVLDADGGAQRALAAQVGVSRVLGDRIAKHHVAGSVLVAQPPKRGPRADVAPGEGTRATAARSVRSITA